MNISQWIWKVGKGEIKSSLIYAEWLSQTIFIIYEWDYFPNLLCKSSTLLSLTPVNFPEPKNRWHSLDKTHYYINYLVSKENLGHQCEKRSSDYIPGNIQILLLVGNTLISLSKKAISIFSRWFHSEMRWT